ncbi:unnamed protein product, partial [Heterosigma akashiwo]
VASGLVAFLGHVVGRHGISPDPKKVEAVKNLARPNTKKQVRQFLGMVGFYRSLIKNFSITAAPLHQLTRKVMPERLKWDDECQKAFDALKETITSHPVLRLPDFSLPFILECDASKTGVGAALMQKTEDGEVVAIAYASRLNNSAQRNYSVFDLELLAIVFGVTKYRSYIYGRTVCIRTDHAALTNLMSISRPSGRLARYQMLLSEYSFTTEFKPGRDNYVADCLSRMRNDGPDGAGEIAIPKEQTSRHSRYPEAHIFSRPPTGKDVAEALVRKVISRWGCPSTIYCDGASIQRFGDFPAMCSHLNINLRHTTGYNPRSNGIIESKVAAIKALVRSLAFEHPHQWKQMLPFALLIYRCSFNRNTGETPYYLNSGR